MKGGVFIACGSQSNPRKIVLGQPDRPTLVPPHIFVPQPIDAQKKRQRGERKRRDGQWEKFSTRIVKG